MASKIISIKPLPADTDTEKIRAILGKCSLEKVQIQDNIAYVEFKDINDIQTLDFSFDNLKISELNGAEIDIVEGDFKWAEGSSSEKDKNSNGSSIEDLSIPHVENLIAIQNCDEGILTGISPEKIKEIFKGYASVNRVVNMGNRMIVEFLDVAEIQRLEADFPGYMVPQLGEKADIDLVQEGYDVKKFAEDWTLASLQKQKVQELPIPSIPEDFPKQESTQEKVLHSDTIPTFQKLTSMESNFMERTSSYTEVKNKQEIGEIGQDNQNNKQHQAVTTVYEDQEIIQEEMVVRERAEELERVEVQRKREEERLREVQSENLRELERQETARLDEEKKNRELSERKRKIELEEEIIKEFESQRVAEDEKTAEFARQQIDEIKQTQQTILAEKLDVQMDMPLSSEPMEKEKAEQEETVTYPQQNEEQVTYPKQKEERVTYPKETSKCGSQECWKKYSTVAFLLSWGLFIVFVV